MKSDSENECLIEEESSDEKFSSSENESDDDCLDSAGDWCRIDITFSQPSHPKFSFTGSPGIKNSYNPDMMEVKAKNGDSVQMKPKAVMFYNTSI
ncbi:uncharacterized protein NPIL_640891 [Nephila pilipes]|uniref:Uncharacterized protein n=1 Tax=Nephila pilipes TaxID=299642 RepID=A0A8X6U0H6_NEPPI|nr:uncharacterized protein NPIL_640891 [Nephila pilipes]